MNTLELFTVVHPIFAPNPWNAGEGWRWAIHTDTEFHQVDRGCIYAGWEATEDEAKVTLSAVVLACRRAVVAAGCPDPVVQQSLRSDCPLNVDLLDVLATVR
jgi:hypothetical protein